MDDPLKLSALGRFIRVGDLYDYTTDQVFKTDLEQSSRARDVTLKNLIHVTSEKVKQKISLLLEPTRAMKLFHLNVNSHLEASITAELIPPQQVWFNNYINEEDTQQINKPIGVISIHLRISERKESLIGKKKLLGILQSKSPQVLKSATHLVTGVSYGFEAVFALEIPHFICNPVEMKPFFENQLFSEAKAIFSSSDIWHSATPILSEEQKMMFNMPSCRFYTSLNSCQASHEIDNFAECVESLHQLIVGGNSQIYIPVEITISPIAAADVSIPRLNELGPDLMTTLNLIKNSLIQVSVKLESTIGDSILFFVPDMYERLEEFRRCFASLQAQITETIKCATVAYRRTGNKKEVEKFRMIWKSYFSNQLLVNWIMERQQEMFVMKGILKDISISWKPEIIDSTWNLPTKMFTFKTSRVEDPVISTLQKDSKLKPTNNAWITFDAFSSSRGDQAALHFKLEEFFSQHKRRDCNYFLVMSETVQDGVVQTMDRPFPRPRIPCLQQEVKLNEIRKRPTDVRQQIRYPTRPTASSSSDSSPNFLGSSQIITAEDAMASLQMSKTVPAPAALPSTCDAAQAIEEPTSTPCNLVMDESVIKTNEERVYEDIYQGKSFDRVAVEFVNKSQQLKDGQPAVYLLKSDERVNQTGGLRWFDIGKPDQSGKGDHKVIILMGATGSGKSTLIDGMVNYILGVEWTDPFRFRIVDDRAGDQGKSQAHSQTSSVTAYTIHHVEGMKIPYGITIIDTPGFGDTGGVQRDEEITRIITRFLCHPETNQYLNFINAVCFVASSADSRLTPSQQYILNSVSSIFGKNMQDHLRLLVTFSDGMLPPVLEAIRQAGIPGLSNADPIDVRHHKFNNSALFAGNVSNQDGTSFDGIYWKLGHLNFQCFFEKLAEIPNQNLKQTQLIVKSKMELEKLLERVERHLDDIAQKMETSLNFKQTLICLENQLKECENYEIKVDEDKLLKKDLAYGLVACNCKACLQTCGKSSGWVNWRGCFSAFSTSCYTCCCPYHDHTFDLFELFRKRVTVSKTDFHMKEKYDVVSAQISAAGEALVKSQEELTEAKGKGVALLHNIRTLVNTLETSSLQSSKTISLFDHVESIKRRLIQNHQPGYATRLEILDGIVGRMAL